MAAAWNCISALNPAQLVGPSATLPQRLAGGPTDLTELVWHNLHMYTCDVCGANTKTRQGLAGHYRFRHQGVGFTSNYRPKQHSLDLKVDELAGTLKSISETVERLDLQSTMLELLVLRIAEQLGMDAKADVARASAKGMLQVLRKNLTE